jgi:hypothetical protein
MSRVWSGRVVFCRLCGRRLYTAESIERGIGLECRARLVGSIIQSAQLSMTLEEKHER